MERQQPSQTPQNTSYEHDDSFLDHPNPNQREFTNYSGPRVPWYSDPQYEVDYDPPEFIPPPDRCYCCGEEEEDCDCNSDDKNKRYEECDRCGELARYCDCSSEDQDDDDDDEYYSSQTPQNTSQPSQAGSKHAIDQNSNQQTSRYKSKCGHQTFSGLVTNSNEVN
eukprot:252627_1